jgi:hypothetical protein
MKELIEERSYVNQIARMTKKVIELTDILDFTMISEDQDRGDIAEDTVLRSLLCELEERIDNLINRIRC